MARVGSAALVILLCLGSNGARAQSQEPSTLPDLMIDQIKKTVVYLQGDYDCHEPRVVNGVPAVAADGTPIFDSRCSEVGTGFLVAYDAPELGPGMGIPLLVTSKHMIRHPRLGTANGVTEYFDSITAYANTLKANDRGSFISPIIVPIKQNGFLICSIDNSDLEADVAVCPISIPQNIYDFKDIGTDIFVSESKIHELHLNETDEVLFSGLFLSYHGAQRNYPIVRHGKLALIPKEKIPWSKTADRTSMQDLYLAEVTSWGGNSGSPVFVRLAGVREEGSLGGVRYLLLGVMQGYFNAERQAALDTAAVTDTSHQDVKLSDNSGIAAIVPAEKITEIIAQPRVKAYVALIEAMSHAKAGNPSEAETSFKKGIEIFQTSDPDHPLLREAFMRYAEFLRTQGRQREADFRMRMGNGINKTNTVQDDQLR
jgi:hypothetical protein